jgi:hypothetical protein
LNDRDDSLNDSLQKIEKTPPGQLVGLQSVNAKVGYRQYQSWIKYRTRSYKKMEMKMKKKKKKRDINTLRYERLHIREDPSSAYAKLSQSDSKEI